MSRSGPAHPTGAGRLLDVERFERVAAPGATALLRLIGRLQPYARVDDAALALVLDDGHEARRFAPLLAPDPPAAGGRWTVAFPVPGELLADGEARFALQLGDASVELPAPSERVLRAAGEAAEARARELEAQIRRLREHEAANEALAA